MLLTWRGPWVRMAVVLVLSAAPGRHGDGVIAGSAGQAVGVPQTELISASGRLLKVWQGVFDPTDPANVALIEAQLPAKPAAGTR